MQHMEPETFRRHTRRETLGWKKLRSLKHVKFFSSSLNQLLYLVVYLFISYFPFPQKHHALGICLYSYMCQISKYSSWAVQVFPPSVLPLLNFPPLSNSYSVCECAHISIRPLEMPLQFPGRLYWWIYTISIRANAELEIALHYRCEMFLNSGQRAHQK